MPSWKPSRIIRGPEWMMPDNRCRSVICSYTIISIAILLLVNCPGTWTRWYNTHNPNISSGDFEGLWEVQLKYFFEVCAKPKKLEVSLTDGRHYQHGRDIITYNPNIGIGCVNQLQPDGICNDYRIRFCCWIMSMCLLRWSVLEIDDPYFRLYFVAAFFMVPFQVFTKWKSFNGEVSALSLNCGCDCGTLSQ